MARDARPLKKGGKTARPAKPGTTAAKTQPTRRARKSTPPWLLGVLFAALVAAGVVLLPRLRTRTTTPSAGVQRTFASPVEVWELGQAATKRGDLLEAYEILKRGVEQFPNDADIANAFGVTVNNTSYYVRPLRGRLVPVMATSLERVGAAQTALAAYDRASAGKPWLASPFHYRGNLYAAWGLPDDALEQLYQARMRGDSSASLMRTANAIVAIQRGGFDVPGKGFAPDASR
jgi:tetratricopeptide (TPR) repeat protein